MSDTEQLFIVAAVWTVIAAILARFVPNWVGRIALFAILVGVPFWELPYGYINFQKLCGEQATLLIFEKIVPQQTVCADYPYVTLHKDLLKAGFANVEVRGKAGDIKKYTSNATGEISEAVQSSLTSKYCMTFVNNNRLPWRILRHDVLIVRSDTGSISARQSRFNWAGMWWQEEARPVLGNGGSCAGDANRPIVVLRDGTG